MKTVLVRRIFPSGEIKEEVRSPLQGYNVNGVQYFNAANDPDGEDAIMVPRVTDGIGHLVIELIPDEHSCWNCKAYKENPLGLCGKCARFPVNSQPYPSWCMDCCQAHSHVMLTGYCVMDCRCDSCGRTSDLAIVKRKEVC